MTIMAINVKPHQLKSKIGILLTMLSTLLVSCNKAGDGAPAAIRFDELLFRYSPGAMHDSLERYHPELLPFYSVFTDQVIGIGPDSLPGFSEQLDRFTSDTMIKGIYSDITRPGSPYDQLCREVASALSGWGKISGKPAPEVVTYISGFNQAFITLPGILGIGLDRYLGSESRWYKSLDIPVYLRNSLTPDNLPADAVRAWLYAAMSEPSEGAGFLEKMIYEGKIHYLASKLLKNTGEEQLFHYTEEQVRWCRDHEKAMWKYLAEQKVLFSTDRLMARKFLEDAPFTRDFGNDSPGRAGIWIGYRIISSYMKATGLDLSALAGASDAREILSASKYHP